MPKITALKDFQLQSRPVPEGWSRPEEMYPVKEGEEIEASSVLGETERGYIGFSISGDGYPKFPRGVYAPEGAIKIEGDRTKRVDSEQKTNQAGIDLIASYEQMSPEDVKAALPGVESGISRLIQKDVNENQFSAMVSFAFSIGLLEFQRSLVVAFLNDERPMDAARSLRNHVLLPSGQSMGWESRREDEHRLFMQLPEDDKTPEAAPVPDAAPEGDQVPEAAPTPGTAPAPASDPAAAPDTAPTPSTAPAPASDPAPETTPGRNRKAAA